MKRAVLCICVAFACGDDLPDGGDSEEATVACLPADVFSAVERHALDLAATTDRLAGHPSAAEVTGFLLAPALPTPPALSASFFSPADMPCSEPRVYDPVCEAGRCSRIECMGYGAGWAHHLWIDRPVAINDWYFQELKVTLSWEDGEAGTPFTIVSNARGPHGVDASMSSWGVMDTEGLFLEATFPGLHAKGEATLVYVDDTGGRRGRLTIAGVLVAEVDAAGRLVPSGVCP